MATPNSQYRRIEQLRLAILNSRPGTPQRLDAVDRAIHAAMAAPDDGLSLRRIEDLCDCGNQGEKGHD